MVIVHVPVSLRLEASWDFFSKDRMAPKKKSFNSSSTRINAISSREKKTTKQKSHKSLFESLSMQNTWN